jgi:hypothetical protein
MSAIDTFDWYNSRAWKTLDEKAKEFIMHHRKFLMSLRSEDEKKRYVFQYTKEVQERNQQNTSGLRGG